MSGRQRLLFIAAVFLMLLYAALYAQNERVIRWQAVYGAGGYVIEIKNSSGKVIIEKELLSSSYDISKLESGKYSYRITTLNKLKQRGGSTSWIAFTVEKADIPDIKSVSHKLLAWSYDNPDITVKGNSFDQSTKIYLRKGNARIETDTRFISATELVFSYTPGKEDAGVYDLIAVNEGNFEGILPGAIEIVEPEIPVIESVSGEKFYHSRTSELIIKGSKLDTGSVPVIEDDSGRRIKVKYRNISDSEILVTLMPSAEEKGSYTIIILRKGYFASDNRLRLEIIDPPYDEKTAFVKDRADDKEKDKHDSPKTSGDIYIGLGWEYNLPFGPWSDELSASPAGFNIYFAYQLNGIGFLSSVPIIKNTEIEIKAGYVIFDLAAGTSDEYYSIIETTAGLNYEIPFNFINGRLVPFISLGSGLAYSTASIYNYKGTLDYSSLDPVISGGLFIRFRQEIFFSDLFCGWERIFYVSSPIDELKVSLRAGIIF